MLVGFCHFPFLLNETTWLPPHWWLHALQITVPVVSCIATEWYVSEKGTWYRFGVDLFYGWTMLGPYWNWPGQWQGVFALAYVWRASLDLGHTLLHAEPHARQHQPTTHSNQGPRVMGV